MPKSTPMNINKSLTNDIRLDYLDAVRAFALLLGVIFHASLSFIPIFIGWAVMDISTSDIVSVFVMINHSYRMELFFLIAGFFSHLKFHQQGGRSFLKSRLLRIVLPFIIGWLLLRPLIISGWTMGAESMREDVNILNGLLTGLDSLTSLPQDMFIGTHLWFLYYLLVISIGIIILRYGISLFEPLHTKLTQWFDSLILGLCNSRVGIFIVAFPTAFCLWFMEHWTVNTPDKSLVPELAISLLYGGFFFFGWLLHRNLSLVNSFADITWHKLLICIISMVGSVTLSSFEMQYSHSYYMLIKAGFMLSYAIMMWSTVSIIIGLCKRFFARSSQIIRYVADASFWIYLIHLPIVIWLQIAFAELPIHWSLKLISITFITMFISILLYDLFIRTTFIGVALNGKRKSRCIFNIKITTNEEQSIVK